MRDDVKGAVHKILDERVIPNLEKEMKTFQWVYDMLFTGSGIYWLCVKIAEELGRHLVSGEGDITSWFYKNHAELGFERIIKTQYNRTPDFIMYRDGAVTNVEIEYRSSSFFQHRHDAKKVDFVVCFIKDKEIQGVEIIIVGGDNMIDYIDLFNEIQGYLKEQFRPQLETRLAEEVQKLWDNPQKASRLT